MVRMLINCPTPYKGRKNCMTSMDKFDAARTRSAVLYRMVMADHICPWGLKSLHLLKSKGYQVEDRHLATRDEIEAFKAQHGVKPTPQTFINGARVGGYDDLRRFIGGKLRAAGET